MNNEMNGTMNARGCGKTRAKPLPQSFIAHHILICHLVKELVTMFFSTSYSTNPAIQQQKE